VGDWVLTWQTFTTSLTPGQLSLLPLVGRGMSRVAVARCMILLAAVSPSSECLYEGKAHVVYLQVTLCDPHLSA